MRYFRFYGYVILSAERGDTHAKIYNQTLIYLENSGDLCYQNQSFNTLDCAFYG